MYKKIRPEQLFDGYRLFYDKILVLNSDGAVAGIVNDDGSLEDVLQIEGLLVPGFINCHCHLELSHMKGIIPEHTGLLKFVNQVVRKRNSDPAAIPGAIKAALQEMERNGIVAVGDICNTTDTISAKQQSELYFHNFVEVIGFDPDKATEHFYLYKKVYDTYCKQFHPAQVSLTPHAPYSVSTPLWKLLAAFDGNTILSIHNQETPEEDAWFLEGKGGFKALYERLELKAPPVAPVGMSSLRTYGGYLDPHQHLLLVHNVCSGTEDLEYAAARFPAAFWCICPNANHYISKRLPDIPLFLKKGAALVMGTDSLASNYSLDIFNEILRIQEYYPELPLEEMLSWATINGARALNIDKQFGSFEKGKKPGMVIIKDNKAKKLSHITD